MRDDLCPVAVDLAFRLFAFGFAVLFCHGGDVDFCTSGWIRVRPALLVTGPGYPWWRLPAHAPASADELCSPGGAGARVQAHNRSDARRHLPGVTYGRSEAGGRFRRFTACGGRGQTLWDCKVLWCPKAWERRSERFLWRFCIDCRAGNADSPGLGPACRPWTVTHAGWPARRLRTARRLAADRPPEPAQCVSGGVGQPAH